MKHLFSFFFLLVISSYAHAVTFKIASLSPEGSYWMESIRTVTKSIETQTEGRVKFKLYPGGVMGDDKSVLKKMRFKQLNGAALTNSGLSSIYSDIQLYNLVLKFRSLAEIDYVRSKMDIKLTQGLAEKGIISFGFVEIGMTYLMSTQPIRNLSDMKGQKAWAPDNNEIAIAAQKAFSVSPIPLPVRDVLMGLQTGMVNVVATSPIGALALQWHTKVSYLTELPLSYVFGVLALNKKDFEKLSTDDQAIVRNKFTQVLAEINQRSRDDNQKASAALKKQGIEFIAPSPEAAVELRGLMNNIETQLIDSDILSAELVNELNQHLIDFRGR
ncbi:MAG: TRAP transporter substrate-binding protein DctP [Methylococcales bacterium]|nr:TRAP transporter substrate-binding protein DctP [Methylococcales bacterium]